MKIFKKPDEKKNNIDKALLLALDIGTVSKRGDSIKISCGSTTIEEVERLKECFIIDSIYGENDVIIFSLSLK